MESSSNPRRLEFGRIAFSVVLWTAFVVVAHELVHSFLPVTGPVPGAGLKTLAAQALAVTLAALLLFSVRQSTFRITVRAAFATAIWVCLIVLGHYLAHLDAAAIRETMAASREGMGFVGLLVCAITLAILLGLPFAPSVEMGLLMMAVFGRDGAIAAWLATIAGLSLAHAAGRYMPTDRVHQWLERHGLVAGGRDPTKSPMAALLERLGPRPGKGRQVAAFLSRHRYLLFAALINIPGNSVIGGGGGIALICGFTRLYRWPLFILTVALASLPIPLLVFLGLIRVDEWLAVLGG